MVARSFATTLIALFLFIISIPGYSLAASEHAGHDISPAGSHSQGEAVNHQQHDSGQGEHDQSSHSQESSGHGEQSQGHGNSGEGEADPAVRNLLVGGFAGINALIIGIALYMKNRLQRGAAI